MRTATHDLAHASFKAPNKLIATAAGCAMIENIRTHPYTRDVCLKPLASLGGKPPKIWSRLSARLMKALGPGARASSQGQARTAACERMASSREKCLGLKHLSALVAALAIDLENPASAPRKSPGARGADPRRRQHRPSIVCWWRSRLCSRPLPATCSIVPLLRSSASGLRDRARCCFPFRARRAGRRGKAADRARARRKKGWLILWRVTEVQCRR